MSAQVEIDQALCNGCGQCLPCCQEGALLIVNGKVQLAQDRFCDGLGSCLGECPTGALKIVRRFAAPFENPENPIEAVPLEPTGETANSLKTLTQSFSWPIQLRLVGPEAPFLAVPTWVLAADCTAFVYPFFRSTFLTHGPLLIGCSKLDDLELSIDKLTLLLEKNPCVREIITVMMTVPCCHGLRWIADEARQKAGRPEVAVTSYHISPSGIISQPMVNG
jgi:Pyruvate/2-oxoacid:ferredoxin oxidoreductase delta subunit